MFGVLELNVSAGKSIHDDLEMSFNWSFELLRGFDLVPTLGISFVVCTEGLLVHSSCEGSEDEEVGGRVLDKVSDTFCSKISVSDGASSLTAGEHVKRVKSEFTANRSCE